MRLLFAVLLTFVLVSTTSATVINFSSDLVNEGNNITTTNVFITPVSVWAVAPWISHANTGAGGFSPANTTIVGIPTAEFWESVVLPYADNNGWIRGWADDTMSVVIYNSLHPTGLLLHPANNVWSPHCVGQPIGCVEGMSGTIALDGTVLAQGVNMFKMPTYQLWGNGFGAAWEGQIESVPEPMSLLLIGGGLISVGLLRRRRSKTAT